MKLPNRLTPVTLHESNVYIKRAKECFSQAEITFAQNQHYASMILSIHAAIALCDLMCIKFHGHRYKGTDHSESLRYYERIGIKTDDFKKSLQRLGKIITKKSLAEYGQKPLTKQDAELTLKDLSRLKEYVFLTLNIDTPSP